MKLFDKCVVTFSVLWLIMLYSVLAHEEPKVKKEYTGVTLKEFGVIIPDIPVRKVEPPKPNRMIAYNEHVLKGCYLNSVYITGATISIWGGETYYITAYCPWECGFNGNNFPAGWRTASGTICHEASWENRYLEPTTCAIDMSYNRFGDMFYIAEFDRVYIAEDNGAFRGKWIDLFYEDYDSVKSFPTGYYTVYNVEVSEYCVRACDYDVREYINEYQRNSI